MPASAPSSWQTASRSGEEAAAMTRAVTTARAWRVFLVSVVYLPALLTLMVLDKMTA